jgi:hypothetical protein
MAVPTAAEVALIGATRLAIVSRTAPRMAAAVSSQAAPWTTTSISAELFTLPASAVPRRAMARAASGTP